MPTGLAICVGVNEVDSRRYGGWTGALSTCEADADAMRRLAEGAGFDARTLLTAQATAANVLGALDDAASALCPGDILMLSFSGHGGQVPDVDGDEWDDDRRDEVLMLYDRRLVDDEIEVRLRRFLPGVRVLMVTDGCHSASISGLPSARTPPARAVPPPAWAAPPEGTTIAASVLQLYACESDQLAQSCTAADEHSLFTRELLAVWDGGAFDGTYASFVEAIRRRIPPAAKQTPGLLRAGRPDPAFERQRPFTI